jgi:hypothetical protein
VNVLLSSLVDPATMTNFWGALIGLMIALKVALDQYNAAKSKERREADAELLRTNTAKVVGKLDTVAEQTNGKLQDLHNKIDAVVQKNGLQGSAGPESASNPKPEGPGGTSCP